MIYIIKYQYLSSGSDVVDSYMIKCLQNSCILCDCGLHYVVDGNPIYLNIIYYSNHYVSGDDYEYKSSYDPIKHYCREKSDYNSDDYNSDDIIFYPKSFHFRRIVDLDPIYYLDNEYDPGPIYYSDNEYDKYNPEHVNCIKFLYKNYDKH